MKTIVTGGAGFIGHHLCKYLRDQGHEVIVIDDLSVSKNNVQLLNSIGVEFFKADITKYNEIRDLFKDVQIVFHLAAMNRAPKSFEDPRRAEDVNAGGTINVLNAMEEHKVPLIIFTSSSSVYGPREDSLKEDSELHPMHPYGISKMAAEKYIEVLSKVRKFEYVILRLFSVYGPNQLAELDHAAVIPKFISSAKSNIPLPIYGDGSSLRNFTYVGDVVKMMYDASTIKGARKKVINIANPKEISVNEIAKKIISQVNPEAKIRYMSSRIGDPAKNTPFTKRMNSILRPKEFTPFKKGLELTIKQTKRV